MTQLQEMLPLVSIIVPLRNEERYIEGCLESLLRQDYPSERIEIFAVDNGSTDRSRLLVKKYPVRYLFEPRWGAAAARNRGARESHGELLAFVDADCALPQNWVSRLVQWFTEHPDSMLANGRTVGDKKSFLSDYFDFRGRAFFECQETSSSTPHQPPWLITTNLMIRQSVFEKVGGFEESLLPGEDIDLSWRVGLLGHLPKFFPDLAVQERRFCSIRSFFRKNFDCGRVSFFLARRYQPIFPEGSGGNSKQRGLLGLAQKSICYFQRVFLTKNALSPLRRLVYFLLGGSGHGFYLIGKIIAYLQTELSNGSSPVPVLPRKQGLHPLARSLGLSPEDRLLYFASLDETERLSKAAIAECSEEIKDWGGFLKKAGFHRLGGPLYRLFKDLGELNPLGSKIWSQIEISYYWNQAQRVKIERQLGSLLKALSSAGIPVLLLKGAALLRTLYKETPCRPFCDLDLLIHREDYERVKELLKTQGYSEPHEMPFPFPSRWHRQTLGPRINRNAVSLIPPSESGIPVDLHFEVFEEAPWLGLTNGWIWKDAEIANAAGSRAFLPSPTNQLLHLLLHLVKNRAYKTDNFVWFLDIDRWLRTQEGKIDTESFGRFVTSSPLVKEILSLLAFLETYLFTPIPEGISEMIQSKKPERLFLQETLALRENSKRRDPSESKAAKVSGWVNRSEQFFFLFHLTQGWREKCLFLWRWIFPDSEYFARKYPFETHLEKLQAYARHLGAVVVKGISISSYGLRRKFIHAGR